jgi:predicted amidohydrolase
MSFRIATVQAQDIQSNVPAALRVMHESMKRADTEGVDILCFPECFLQGYTLDDKETEERALNLASSEFETILHIFADYKVTIIVGLIEKDNEGLYNTAAVIQQGRLLGAYRKVHLFERNFQPGEIYPAFAVGGLKFGVNICYDARFTEGPAELVTQGAKIIFYPLNNRLPHEKAVNYRDKHIPNLVARAKRSGCWVVSSDVVTQNEAYTGFGCTAIVSPLGKVISHVMELEKGMITVDID